MGKIAEMTVVMVLVDLIALLVQNVLLGYVVVQTVTEKIVDLTVVVVLVDLIALLDKLAMLLETVLVLQIVLENFVGLTVVVVLAELVLEVKFAMVLENV